MAAADGPELVDWMTKAAKNLPEVARKTDPTSVRGRLFRKYVSLFLAVVALALVPKGILDIWFSYQGINTLLVRVQSEQAKSAAEKIGRFINEIQNNMTWEAQLPWQARSDDEWRFDAVRLLRQVPAITELAQIDAAGRERFRISRQAMDVIGSLKDYSRDPAFSGAMASKVYYGPVYFLHQSEPYMTIAVAGAQRDDGMIIAQLNLKFIWDVILQIKVGDHGQAYVVDAQGRLIAHPDISLVLRNTDLSHLAYVQAALSARSHDVSSNPGVVADMKGRDILSAYAPVAPLGWLVFAEMPINEAYAPIYNMLIRSVLLLVAGLALAFLAGLFLARRMVVPIRTLSEGAARIGGGDLTQRIAIKTGDELEALGDQFNNMAIRLQELYATLERKVEERTRQLEAANLAKSHFLAAASHDLRQPLHALGLFIAQLHGRVRADERKRIMARIDTALSAMNELFNALLDISKLDAGALVANVTEFPVAQLLKRLETTFSAAAVENGLSLRIVASGAWIRSDPILLERILANLVSNAIRYTKAGGVVVGCRKQNGELRIEVWDSGSGIPEDQKQNIFVEFYRLAKHDRGGLGLGLAIVDRLCRLLGHPIALTSTVGKGSCFAVTAPLVQTRVEPVKPQRLAASQFNISNGKLIVVVDDDPLVLEGMNGLLRSWGCRVVTGSTEHAALAGLAKYDSPPDAIISDYHLCDGQSGVDVIARIRSALSTPIPAFLMTADNNPDTLRIAQANGFPLLHKPVDPMILRATLAHAVQKRREVDLAH